MLWCEQQGAVIGQAITRRYTVRLFTTISDSLDRVFWWSLHI